MMGVRRLTVLVSSVALSAAATAAVSQEIISASEEDAIFLDPIIITGQKLDRSLQDTTASVVVIDPESDFLTPREPLIGAVERIPNVEPFVAERGIVIRGIGQTGLGFGETNFPNTRSPTDLIATYVDGIPVSVYAGPVGFWDVAQVEILRGAQSTLLGRGSLGGAVIYETVDPDFAFGGQARIMGGTEETGALSFAVGGPTAVSDNLAFRIAVDGLSSQGFNKNIVTGDYEDARQNLNGRLKFLYEGDSGQEIAFTAIGAKVKMGSSFVNGALWPDERVAVTNTPDVLENDILGMSLRANWDFAERFAVETVTAYAHEDATRETDVDQTPSPLFDARFDDKINTISQEVRLRYFGERIEGFGAVYAEHFQGDGAVDAGIFGTQTTDQQNTTLAAFGEGTWTIADPFDLIFGLRVEGDSTKTVFSNGMTSVRSEADFFTVLPKVGFSYDFDPQTRLYATVQRGFRAGGAGGSLLSGTPYTFDPEYTWNYDLGLRHRSLDGALQVGANLFYVDWRDQQLEVPSGSGIPGDNIIANVGHSQSYGFELDAEYQVTSRFRLFGALGLLQTEILDTDASNANLIGKEFTYAPNTSATISGRYVFDNGFDVGALANWRGSFYSDAANTPIDKVDGRFLVDAGIGYEIGSTRIALDVTNLFDEQYLNQSSLALVLLNPDGTVAPGPGRAITLSVVSTF